MDLDRRCQGDGVSDHGRDSLTEARLVLRRRNGEARIRTIAADSTGWLRIRRSVPRMSCAIVVCIPAAPTSFDGVTRSSTPIRPTTNRYRGIALTSVTNRGGGIARRQLISRFSKGAFRKSRAIARVHS